MTIGVALKVTLCAWRAWNSSSGTAPEFPVLRKPYRFEQLRQAIAELTGTAPQRDVA